MLRRAAAIPLLSAVSFNLTTATRAADPRPAHRTRPSDPAWPSAGSWEQLNRQVGGQLIRVQTPLAACADAADNTACQVILKNLKNPYFVGDQPGLTQTSGWADAWMSALSAYAVVARGTAHVVAAVNFARANNLRLVVKGGGHSYQGTSNAPDSLLIWTRAMNNIVVYDEFVGQGCAGTAAQPAVRGAARRHPGEPARRLRRQHQRDFRCRVSLHAARLHRPGVERGRGAPRLGQDGRAVGAPPASHARPLGCG